MAREPFLMCNIAMPAQYVITGFITATFNGLLYGILMGTMAVNANVYGTAQTAITAPWALKCIAGFMSDQFPLMGYKRRYYCIIGHGLVAFVCLSLALFYNEPVPYFCDRQTKTICNPRAAEDVHVIVITFMVVAFGTMVADSACDGLMLEIAKAQTTTANRFVTTPGHHECPCLPGRVYRQSVSHLGSQGRWWHIPCSHSASMASHI